MRRRAAVCRQKLCFIPRAQVGPVPVGCELIKQIEAVLEVNDDFFNIMLDDNYGFHIFFKSIKSGYFKLCWTCIFS